MDPRSCLVVIMVLLGITLSWCLDTVFGQNIYNVVDFGATGNGTNDDSEAVLRAWKSVCGRKMGTAVLKFPAGRTYLLKPLLFQGPCLSNHLLIQIDGYIKAPASISEWKGYDRGSWLHFLYINGLIVNGKGTFDGYGDVWWNITKKGGSIKAPAAGD